MKDKLYIPNKKIIQQQMISMNNFCGFSKIFKKHWILRDLTKVIYKSNIFENYNRN